MHWRGSIHSAVYEATESIMIYPSITHNQPTINREIGWFLPFWARNLKKICLQLVSDQVWGDGCYEPMQQ